MAELDSGRGAKKEVKIVVEDGVSWRSLSLSMHASFLKWLDHSLLVKEKKKEEREDGIIRVETVNRE